MSYHGVRGQRPPRQRTPQPKKALEGPQTKAGYGWTHSPFPVEEDRGTVYMCCCFFFAVWIEWTLVEGAGRSPEMSVARSCDVHAVGGCGSWVRIMVGVGYLSVRIRCLDCLNMDVNCDHMGGGISVEAVCRACMGTMHKEYKQW